MPYYKTPLPGPITILCAGRIEGAWGVFGQEPAGRGGLRVSTRLTSDPAPNTRTEEADLWTQLFSLLLAATHRGLDSWGRQAHFF